MSSMKLELDNAEMLARKRLARRMVDFETIYVLRRDDRKGYLLLLALEEEQWRILESVSLDHSKGRMEELHESQRKVDCLDFLIRQTAKTIQ